MKRRVCETCLYFEPAGFNKTGWCHHPLRRQNTEVRLMVRANELGCRNGWNADLWVPAETDGTTQREHPLAPIGSRARAEVAPAEQTDLITSIVAARTDNIPLSEERAVPVASPRASVEEDIFVNQTPALSWNTAPVSTKPATALVQNPKEAIIQARNQFRERRIAEGRIADRDLAPSTLVSSDREARRVDDFDLTESEPSPESVDPRFENRPVLPPRVNEWKHEGTPVSPVSRHEIQRPFPAMTDFPEDRTRFESVPACDSTMEMAPDADGVPPVDTWIETRQLDTVPLEPYEVDELFVEDELVARAEPVTFFEEEELSVRHRESKLNRFLRQRRERHEAAARSHATTATRIPTQHAYTEPERPAEFESHHHLVQEPTDRRMAQREQAAFLDQDVSVVRSAPPATFEFRPSRRTERVPLQTERGRFRPAQVEDDDFVLPPPPATPEPRPEPVQPVHTRTARRYEPDRQQIDQSPRNRTPISQPADEFGDRPLFADRPIMTEKQFDSDLDANRNTKPIAGYRMERVCRTCRSFRPSENGDRGWCTNQWAFDHRRMVDADELSCKTSMGDWWTPKDDVWRRDFDISRHAQQTPRVNELLLGSEDERNDRRRSGS